VIPLLLALVWAVRRETRRQFALLVPFGILLAAYLFYRHYLFGGLGAPSDHLFVCAFLRKLPACLNPLRDAPSVP